MAVAAIAVVGVAMAAPASHADHPTAEVSFAPGSSVPGCEATDECFIPADVTVDVGGEVTWNNDDTAAHTITSGTPEDGPDGTFDSGLIMPGTTFSYTFEGAGVYPYFSVVHPWAMGTVTVSGEAHGNGPGIALGGNGGMRWLEPGMFVVADTNNHRIQAFGPNGSYAFEFGSYGDDPGEFDSPTDVAIGPDGRIAVADTNNHRIQVFHPDGSFAFAFGSYEGEAQPFSEPVGVAIGPDGRIAVVDINQRRIQVFHPDGSFAFAFGSYGAGPKQFISPVDVAIGPDGRIAVADPGRINVQVFHPNGTFAFATNRGGSSGAYMPDGVAFGPDGRIILNVYYHGTLQLFHPNGTEYTHNELWAEQFPVYDLVDVAIGPSGRIAMVDIYNHTIAVGYPNGTLAFAFGSYGAGLGEFDSPSAVAVRHRPPLSAAPTPVIVVEPGGGPGGTPGGPYNFTTVGDAASLAINVAGLAGPGQQPPAGPGAIAVTFPAARTDVITSFASVSFPPGVQAAGVPADGLIAMRVSDRVPVDELVQRDLAYDGSGRVALQRVVEVGNSDEASRITFDLPVRILLEGQGGGRAFYIDDASGPSGMCSEFVGQFDGRMACADGTLGRIVPIDKACAADDTGRVHRQMGGAGECQLDTADGGKAIYTYHLTRFGTALSGIGVPAPSIHTCSVGVGMPSPDVSAAPGERSPPVQQSLINSGSLPLARVELGATPWSVEGGDGGGMSSGDSISLPPSASEVSEEGAGAGYAAVGNGTAVARGLGGGDVAPLWFRVNLAPYGGVQDGTLVQHITYQAECSPP